MDDRVVTLGLLLLGGGIVHLLLGIVVRRLHRLANASSQNWDDVLISAVETPIRVVLWVFVAQFALRIYQLAPGLHRQLVQAYDTALVLLLAHINFAHINWDARLHEQQFYHHCTRQRPAEQHVAGSRTGGDWWR